MFKGKKKIEFNSEELRIVLYALNEFRTQLLNENRYTDAVDELIIKFAHAPIKKFRIKMTEV